LARKILLADDSVTAQNMGRKILADAGYEVIAVNNGSAALKKIAELKPDLAILDVYMPGYSGLEVCQRLKESPETARIPVLLTVGKLEPFKPEEAQRVRAEGYIVKPFEASELLSALSKLEDKVVPRAEPSKPGRFARAMAAVEESSRGDAAIKENGWKSRIGFPHKKTETEKKVADEKVADESLIYNALNRDLRTVVETTAEKTAEMKQQLSGDAEETSVDVAALAPSGLPGDVTPEEVAAIAAAVAKMQMAAATALEHDQRAEAASQAELVQENKVEASTPAVQIYDDGASAATQGEKALSEESKEEHKLSELAAPGIDLPRSGHERPDQERTDQERSDQQRSDQQRSDQQRSDQQRSDQLSSERDDANDLPVTMAATAESVAAASVGASRWTAVAVALDTQEAGLSLEQEMQKAYAAAEPYLAAVVTLAEERSTSVAHSSVAHSSAPAESAVQEQVAAISNLLAEPTPAPEPLTIAAPAESEPSPFTQSEAMAPTPSLSSTERPSIEESPIITMPQSEITTVTSASAPPEKIPTADFGETNPVPVDAVQSPGPANVVSPETISANTPFANLAAQPQPAAVYSEAPQELPSVPVTEGVEALPSRAYAPLARAVEPQVVEAEIVESEAEHDNEPKLDTETLKSTAAAWATWRQIRDTSKGPEVAQADPKETQSTDFGASQSASEETAAAVAAGAEHSLQASTDAEPSRNPSDVASIVDSVLADLRPKLMEEISRKMAQKK
jgi:CheY-like chemotaxis protein